MARAQPRPQLTHASSPLSSPSLGSPPLPSLHHHSPPPPPPGDLLLRRRHRHQEGVRLRLPQQHPAGAPAVPRRRGRDGAAALPPRRRDTPAETLPAPRAARRAKRTLTRRAISQVVPMVVYLALNMSGAAGATTAGWCAFLHSQTPQPALHASLTPSRRGGRVCLSPLEEPRSPPRLTPSRAPAPSPRAVPMATDIAFAMGVYGFFRNRMPMARCQQRASLRTRLSST